MFEKIIGQNRAITLLEQAIALDRIAPAYLFVGASGIGRSLSAAQFAQQLLTRNLSEEKQSLAERKIEHRNHPDFRWLEPTFSDRGELVTASQALAKDLKRKTPPKIRIEQIRQLIEFINRPPLEAERLVVVIEDAHTMAEAPANALLKTLEEPGKATLILIAPSTESLLSTIVSRCQPVPFQRLCQQDLQQVLENTGHTEILEHPELIKLAQGSPGEVISAWAKLQTIPTELLQQLKEIPKHHLAALKLAKTITQELDLATQLWLVDYLQYCYWQKHYNSSMMKQWEETRKYLLSYVQPRLVWETTLLEFTL
ncbi:MAG: DNA polymerase III subunit delta' [Cyanobacteria bacterium P01_F01_bin.143]